MQVFKSHLDARYAGIYQVTTHDRRTVDAVPVDTTDQIALHAERRRTKRTVARVTECRAAMKIR